MKLESKLTLPATRWKLRRAIRRAAPTTASVHYQLHVPQNARLDRINLVNGKLRVDDLAGRADLSTVNGEIGANYASLNNVREIKLKSVNGSIELGLPDAPNAEVKASTVSGGIRS